MFGAVLLRIMIALAVSLQLPFEAAYAAMQKTRVFHFAESLGGVESLITHPATMTHAAIPREQREARGVTDGLMRLSVGIEDQEDLIADLDGAISSG